MALANFDLDAVRAKVLAAYSADDPILHRFREFARRLADGIKPLRTYSVNAVSFVSADGGDNRLAFNPSIIELVRVVDSRGNECALDAVASTADASELDQRGIAGSQSVVGPLERLCARLQRSVTGLSYLLGGLGTSGKSTGAMRAYRDIVEWAVLCDLVASQGIQWGGDTILVRDGLLRTKTFKREVFPEIDRILAEGVAAHADRNVKLSIVGVAKQSAVLSRLAVALELEATFHRPYPCFVRVPRDIEEACYYYDRTWLDTAETTTPTDDGKMLYQSLGSLFLVKFGDYPLDPVWPVDVAVWQEPEADKILGQLTVDAQQGFPIPDYPMCIQRAHDYAKLTGLEIVVLQDVLMEGMCQSLTSEQAERLYRMRHLGQSLADRRYKEG
jgi:hypothetical protein